MVKRKRLVIIGIAFLVPAAAQLKKVLTNEDLLAQAKAGTTEADLLEAIEKSEVRFDTSAGALIAFKNGGVSEAVVLAVLSASRRNVPAAPASTPGPLPTNSGVYLARDGQYVEIPPETFNWKRTALESVLRAADLWTGTRGRGPEPREAVGLNGTLPGRKSREAISPGSEFVIVCTEGTIGAEYRLVRIDEKPDKRQFSVNVQFVGGVYFGLLAPERSGGRVMDIETEKIAPRTYRVRLPDLEKGQYGFLAPGFIGADSPGAIHAFGIR